MKNLLNKVHPVTLKILIQYTLTIVLFNIPWIKNTNLLQYIHS